MKIVQQIAGAAKMPGIAWSFSRKGHERRARNFDDSHLSRSFAGRQLAVTGGNGGIGFAVAKSWAERDADVWLLCRSQERGEHAREQLASLGSGTIHLELVDLADAASIDQLAARITAPRIDALVHNAGALVHELKEVSPGIELTFACHVLGPQRMTHKLLPLLRESQDPRVVYVSSGGMYSEKLSIETLYRPEDPFDGVKAYALAKRAQVCLVQTWASHYPEVSFLGMHPGWVDTPGVETALPSFYRTTRKWLRTTEQGADTIVWLSLAKDLKGHSGEFFLDRETVSRHLLPGTQERPEDRDELWSRVESTDW